jgi:hypothetical protein
MFLQYHFFTRDLKNVFMKKMVTRFFFATLVLAFAGFAAQAQFPTIYASVASGSYNVAGTWETFTNSGNNTPGAQGTGTPAATTPSGTHFIYIRSGHTISMNAGNRSCHGLFIEAGAKLWANEAAARRLQLVTGGTGFTYPQTDVITNNGELGGVGDGLFFEAGTNCQNVTITGTGSTIVQRLRVPGGLASTLGGVVNITIDQNITFGIANNYATSLVYNPQATDNYTLTLNPGRTLTISDPGGYFNNNSIGSGGGWGNYTYNINGILNLSASIQTSNFLSAVSPEGGTVTVNIGGSVITGAAFNSSPVAPGVGNINVGNGVIVDATLATVMNFNGNSFTMATGTAGLKRTVSADGSKVRFPVGTANGSNTHVSVSNVTGANEQLTVSIKNTFTNPAPANTLPREWNLVETTPGGNSDTLRFEWTTAEEANGFSGASPVYIRRWDGAAYESVLASVSGTGTAADPYVAKGSAAFSQLGLFILSNSGTTPVAFVNLKAFQKLNGVQVEFGNATESDVVSYVIERSADGSNFTALNTLQAKTNNGGLNSYTYFDAAPNKGNNYYRIRVTERNGNVKISNTLNINLRSKGTWVNAYPNPVKNNTVNVQLENFEKSIYTIAVFNQSGQKVYAKSINHLGGTATFTVELPASVSKGVYSLQVGNAISNVINKIVVE